MFTKARRVCLSPEEFNEKLDYYSEIRAIVKESDILGFHYAVLSVKTINVSLIVRDYNEYNKIQTFEFITKLDGTLASDRITGLNAYTQLRKMADFEIIENEVQMDSAKPLLYYNPKYEGKWVNAVSYDVNSAYAYAMIQDMPDTNNPLGPGEIEEGQVGFSKYDALMTTTVGDEAYYRFNLIESPFKRFVEVYYDKKKNAKNAKDKQAAKDYLNFSVGYLQRKNPFLRARIIELCNERIKNLMDENTIFCNTDCIVSLVERPDLQVSNELGDFKLENQGEFAYKGFNYQWKNIKVSVRGVSKSWFKDDFNILTDTMPTKENNKYKFNYATLHIEEANNEKK